MLKATIIVAALCQSVSAQFSVKLAPNQPALPGMTPLVDWEVADPALAARIGLDRWYASPFPVVGAEINEQATGLQTADIPNDPMFYRQWSLMNVNQGNGCTSTTLPPGAPGPDIRAIEAWQIAHTSPVTIAVIDSGVTPHLDLAPMPPGWSHDNGTTNDDCNHGTHVAGTIGALTGNEFGVAGVVWGAKILPVRVLTWCGGTSENFGLGLIWSADRSAVSNSSLQWYAFSQFAFDAMDYAAGVGHIMVAASGNYATAGVIAWPARHPAVIAVGATDRFNTVAQFSNTGPQLDMVAPGQEIYNISAQSPYYQCMSGTSMASPHVAGAVALILALQPEADLAFVRRCLHGGAIDLGMPYWDQGWGRLDLANTLAIARCPADCDYSGDLSVADFACFLQRFAAGHPYANCDGSTEAPALNVADFVCFMNEYARGCP
jgi:subtilisin family serine protease